MHDSLHLLPEFSYLTEVLAEVVPSGCKLSDVLALVVRFGVLFVDGEEASVESAVGLWGELWAIHRSTDSRRWIEAWHQSTSALLDFESENCAVEVKTTLNEAALHHLRQRQVDTRLHDGWLLSIRIYASASGLSIGDLLDAIAVRVESHSHTVVIDKSVRVMKGDLRALRGWKFELQAEGVAALAMTDVPCILGEQSPALRSIAFEVDLNEVLVARRRSFEEVDERMVE
ncbi:PD-(D/E)XK motif protein [Curtobacterium caseinilyticum]